jgi:hypothetical protein
MPNAVDFTTLADVRDWLNLSANAMPPTQIMVTAGGTGYTSATATVVAGTGAGSGLVLGSPTFSGGAVVAIPITTPGTYTVAPTIAITGNGAGAAATVYFAADTALARLITSCSKLMLRLMNRDAVLVEQVTERRNGSGTDRMALRCWPVVSVASVTVSNTVIPASPDGVQAGWVTDGYSVLLVGSQYPAYFSDGYGGRVGGQFVKGYQNVAVVYSYGWTAVPEDIAQAAIELVAQRWTRKGHVDQDSVSTGGPVAQTTSYQKGALPKEVQQVCDRYKILPIFEL